MTARAGAAHALAGGSVGMTEQIKWKSTILDDAQLGSTTRCGKDYGPLEIVRHGQNKSVQENLLNALSDTSGSSTINAKNPKIQVETQVLVQMQALEQARAQAQTQAQTRRQTRAQARAQAWVQAQQHAPAIERTKQLALDHRPQNQRNLRQ